jgi:proteasome lid subunit RPN8/RPN11
MAGYLNNKIEQMNDTYQREVSCFFVPKHGVLSVTSNNSAGAVEFDFFTIWQKLKEIEYDEVCMIHSHPPGANYMSQTDFNMVYGWVQAIGKPIYFPIVTENQVNNFLCQRSPENKNKVLRDTVDVLVNETFEGILEAVKFMSYLDNDISEDQMDEVIKILNDDALEAEYEIKG